MYPLTNGYPDSGLFFCGIEMKKPASVIFGHSWPLLRKVPVLRFLIPFTAGTLLSEVFQVAPDETGVYGSLLLQIIGWAGLLLFYRTGFRRRHHFGMLLGALFLMQGCLFAQLRTEIFHPCHLSAMQMVKFYHGTMESTVREKPHSFKALVKIDAVFTERKWQAAEGKVMCYFKKNGGPLPAYGEKLVLKMMPERIDPATSPAAALYAHRQICHRAFVQQFRRDASCSDDFSFFKTAADCRLWVTGLFLQQMHHSKEAAIAIALLVGEEVAIDDEINAAYAATGTLHVLSVSGMHVGLIFFLLSFICKPLLKWKHGQHIYYPLIMLLVWCYAFVAGGAPSIVRAAMMCMFFLIAKWIDRRNQGFGALGASLFIILLINPFNLYEPGMQLSFFAVLGIIWLQRPIFRIWLPKNIIAYKLWEMTSVSLAAQILTLPVSLFNFGQFPNYFIIANLMVIPITTACIYSLIAQVVLSPVELLCDYVTSLNLWLLRISNFIVMEMKEWPGAVSYWKIYAWEAVLLYAVILDSEAWLRTKKFMPLARILILIILMTIIRLLLII